VSRAVRVFFFLILPFEAVVSAAEPSELAVAAQQQELVFRQHLEDLSSVAGPYGKAMIEAHEQYGHYLLEEERYEAAAEQFKQSWQLSRINFGLYSEEQLPHLHQMITALSELQRWEEVHDLHRLGFLVGSRIYPPDDLRYVLAAELYTAWQWETLTQNRLARDAASAIQSARELSELYQSILDRVENALPGNSIHTLNLIVGKARTDLAIAHSVVRLGQYGNSTGFRGRYADPRCRQDPYPALSQTNCSFTGQVHFDPMAMNYPPVSRTLAGLYITQVDAALIRLEEILQSEAGISSAEKKWIENLAAALRAESDSLLYSN
jgi:hypothetical protein